MIKFIQFKEKKYEMCSCSQEENSGKIKYPLRLFVFSLEDWEFFTEALDLKAGQIHKNRNKKISHSALRGKTRLNRNLRSHKYESVENGFEKIIDSSIFCSKSSNLIFLN